MLSVTAIVARTEYEQRIREAERAFRYHRMTAKDKPSVLKNLISFLIR